MSSVTWFRSYIILKKKTFKNLLWSGWTDQGETLHLWPPIHEEQKVQTYDVIGHMVGHWTVILDLPCHIGYELKKNKYKQIAEQFIVPHLTKGHNSIKRKGRVIVLAHCTPSEHALSAYKVSTKSIHWFWSYAPDKKCGRKDARTDGRTERQRSANL